MPVGGIDALKQLTYAVVFAFAGALLDAVDLIDFVHIQAYVTEFMGHAGRQIFRAIFATDISDRQGLAYYLVIMVVDIGRLVIGRINAFGNISPAIEFLRGLRIKQAGSHTHIGE